MPQPLGAPYYSAYDANGNPLSGGLLYTYVAGTSTPQATYTDSTLLTANPNPVVLNSSGQAAVWCPNTSVYKFVQKDSTNTTIWTQDNVQPAGGYPFTSVGYPDGFQPETRTFAFISATSFSVTGVDATGTYTNGRILRTTNSGGTVYSIVSSSSFSTNTTVTVANISGVLDSGLSAISYGLATNNGPLPSANLNSTHVAYFGNTGTLTTNVEAVLGNSTYVGTKVIDQLNEFNTTTGAFTPKVAGTYRVTANLFLSNVGVTFSGTTALRITLSGTTGVGAAMPLSAAVNTGGGVVGCAQYTQFCSGGSTIDIRAIATFSAGSVSINSWSFTIERIA